MPFSGQTFDRETLDLLTGVFKEVWEEVQRRGVIQADLAILRATLAAHIMDAASDGERDPLILKMRAMRVLRDLRMMAA
jgi:hypothetical protein